MALVGTFLALTFSTSTDLIYRSAITALLILAVSLIRVLVYRILSEKMKAMAYFLSGITTLLPAWYRDLRRRTSRYERRRIAYMWTRLPSGTRSILDSDTVSFMQWADLVVMGAVLEEDGEANALPGDWRVMRPGIH